MVDKAYKPFGSVSEQYYTAVKKITPPYDDVGVSYKGFSKTLLSGDEYRLNPQSSVIYRIGGLAVGVTDYNFVEGKTFYCTQIVMSITSLGASIGQEAVTIRKKDGSFLTTLHIQAIANGDWITESFLFPVPLNMGDEVELTGSSNGCSTRAIFLYGWIE